MTAVVSISDTSALAALTALMTPDLVWLFTEARLVTDEDREQYVQVALAVARSIQPRDGVARLAVKRITDLAWNDLRLRGVTATLIDVGRRSAVARRGCAS
jgi:hypothetical protein